MDTRSNIRLEEVFALAKSLAPTARAAWLDATCANQPELRAEVEELLRSHDAAAFMDTPAVSLDAQIEEQLARLKPEEAGDRIGNCKLLERIGEGGFGAVWLAAQEYPIQRQVALKIIKLGMDTREVIARFEQERQALAVMDHPNIAKVYDAGATQFGRPYFVMELVRGTRITDYCDEANLPTRERLKLFIKVCQAVQHAHQKGIIHRDLKPSNILVTLHDGAPVPKVIDFGVAKATQGRLTEIAITTNVEQLVGTPLYMSPEQAGMSGVDVDTRSDIYSLGVVLYELLTGRTPFDPGDVAKAGYLEIRRLICESESKKPSTAVRALLPPAATIVAGRRQCEPAELIRTLRGDLDWISMKAIEKDRTRRYETANGLALDIQRYLADEPVSATPPSRTYRFRKFVRRHKLVLSAVTAVAAALVLGLIASLRQADRATRAEVQAVANERIAVGEKEKAAASELRAKRISYATDMNLVQEALRENNVGLARQLLDRNRPAQGEPDLRNWEWRYLYQQARSGARAMLPKRTGVPVFSASYSPDGTLLLVGYSDGKVDLWNTATQKLEQSIPRAGGSGARAVFSPIGGSFAAAMGSGVVKMVDTKTGTQTDLCTVKGAVRDLSYSRDGEWLAVLSRSPDAVTLCRTTDGQVKDYPLPERGGTFFNNVRISPDKQRLYVSCGAFVKPAVRCLKVSDGQVIWEHPIGLIDEDEPEAGRDLGFSAMDLSPDGRTLIVATGYRDPQIRVLDAENGQLVKRLKGHTRYVLQVAFSRNGRVLASTSEDQTVRLWDTATWTKLMPPLLGHNLEVNALAISADGRFLASGNKDGEVLLWDTQIPPPNRGVQILPSRIRKVTPLAVSRMVLCESEDHRWSLMDLLTLGEEPLPPSELAPNGSQPRFTPKRYRRSEPRLDRASLGLHGQLCDPAISPDGKLLVVGSQSGQIGFFDATSLPKIKTIKIDRSNLGSIFAVAFSPDGRRLVLSSGGPQGIELWDVAIFQKLLTLSTNYSLLGRAEFTDDGNTLLASAGPTAPSGAVPWHVWPAPSFQEIEDAERSRDAWPQADAFRAPSRAPNLSDTKVLLEAEYQKRINHFPSPEEIDRRDEALANLAELLFQEHRYAESEPFYREFLENLKRRAPRDESEILLATKKLLGAVLAQTQIDREASDAGKLAARTKQADALVDEVLASLIRQSSTSKGGLGPITVAMIQVWLGRESEYRTTARKLIEEAEKTTTDGQLMRLAAVAGCLMESNDPESPKRAVRLAKKAAKFAKGQLDEAWYQQALGLANYRLGDYEEARKALMLAEEATAEFTAAERPYGPALQTSVRFIRSMAHFRRGDEAVARQLFAQAQAEMKPLPLDARQVLASTSIMEDLMVALAWREAKTLLGQ